jgi:hypothetical protein
MKKLMLRILGITAIVLLLTLPKAGAAVGDCHIVCCDGTAWNGPPPSGSTCCQLFESLCGYWGDAYQETAFGEAYCLNYGPCGG